MEDLCKVPCFFCGMGLRNLGVDSDNHPSGGTEFIGGGAYGSAISDVQYYRFAINLCDSCLKDAITSRHVLKVVSAPRVHQPRDLYEILTEQNDQDEREVTEAELLDALKKDLPKD